MPQLWQGTSICHGDKFFFKLFHFFFSVFLDFFYRICVRLFGFFLAVLILKGELLHAMLPVDRSNWEYR